MKNFQVAIVSKNKEFARLIELEGKFLGFSPFVFEKNSSDISDLDLCFIDTEGLRQMPQALSAYNVFVLHSGFEVTTALEESSVFVEYPLSIEQIRSFYLSAYDGKNDKSYTDDLISFYKHSENIVNFNGRSIFLSPKEYELLKILCEHSGEYVSREIICNILKTEEGNMPEVYIFKLRKKLEGYSDKRLIFNERNIGYKINARTEWK